MQFSDDCQFLVVWSRVCLIERPTEQWAQCYTDLQIWLGINLQVFQFLINWLFEYTYHRIVIVNLCFHRWCNWVHCTCFVLCNALGKPQVYCVVVFFALTNRTKLFVVYVLMVIGGDLISIAKRQTAWRSGSIQVKSKNVDTHYDTDDSIISTILIYDASFP